MSKQGRHCPVGLQEEEPHSSWGLWGTCPGSGSVQYAAVHREGTTWPKDQKPKTSPVSAGVDFCGGFFWVTPLAFCTLSQGDISD